MAILQKGDLVGIISPSAPITAFCPNRFKRGIDFLKKIGYNVLIGKNVNNVSGFTAGLISERLSDIHDMFLNKDVRAVIVTIGGYNANDLLDGLDYEMIGNNNDKLFIGYSDATILLHALQKKSGVKGVIGPMVLPQFGEFPEINNFTLNSFEEILQNLGSGKEYKIPISDNYTEEMLMWDEEDNRPREMKRNLGLEIVCDGIASGILMPGNLNSMCKLIGTEFMPDLKNAILFLEDDSEESASTVQRMLQQLKQAGFLSKIRGIVFGRFQEKSDISADDLKFILKNVFNEISFPVIGNADFGHTDPMVSLPIGNEVKIDTGKREIVIKL